MGVDVDQARREPAPGCIDPLGIARICDGPDFDDPAVAHQHIADQPAARAVEYRRPDQHHVLARQRSVV